MEVFKDSNGCQSINSTFKFSLRGVEGPLHGLDDGFDAQKSSLISYKLESASSESSDFISSKSKRSFTSRSSLSNSIFFAINSFYYNPYIDTLLTRRSI